MLPTLRMSVTGTASDAAWRSILPWALYDMPSRKACERLSRAAYSPSRTHDDKSPAVKAPRTDQSPCVPTGAPIAIDAMPRGHWAGSQPRDASTALVVRKLT